VLTDVRTMSATGWYGDPSGATEAEARSFVESLAEEIAGRLSGVFEALAKAQPTGGPA
jgi:creatinine amidohydrolase/Fe(II)-dependent formamide hydrolase-like protein